LKRLKDIFATDDTDKKLKDFFFFRVCPCRPWLINLCLLLFAFFCGFRGKN